MKSLLSLCLLLSCSAVLSGAGTVRNWYFDFYSGKTVCEVRGTKANEKTETIVIERAFGQYRDDAFVVDSKVESDSGTPLMSGTTRWQQVGDHFEAEIRAGGTAYQGVLRLLPTQEAVLEIFRDANRVSRGEYHIRSGTLYGRIDIYDDAGKVVTICNSECKKEA